MAKRATFDELLVFANKIREAGGGNPLDALMPAVPEDPYACLIARNLNFNCYVDEGADGDMYDKDGNPIKDPDWDPPNPWIMGIEDPEVVEKIGKSLGLKIFYYYDGTPGGIVLPKKYGQVAEDFDRSIGAIIHSYDGSGDVGRWVYQIDPNASAYDKKLLKEFWPYIEESIKETYTNATFINEDGSIVV